jgi:hypothetical protein
MKRREFLAAAGTVALAPVAGVSLTAAGRAARRGNIARARQDPSAFVDGLFGFQSAPFQREWHRQVETHDRLILWAPVEHGKTARMMGHAIWWLGRNPESHGLIVGESSTAAVKLLSSIRRTITESPWVREVFPDLKPAEGRYAKWTDFAIRVAGQRLGDKDYSLQAIGVDGAILGARLDWVIGDDLCTFHTTATSLQRQKVRDWWVSTIEGRLLKDAKAVILGNAWFPDDVMHRLHRENEYAGHRVEGFREREDGTVDPESILWPAQWSAERIAMFIKRSGSRLEANRQLRCIAYASSSAQFELEWFDRAFALGADTWRKAFGVIGPPRFLTKYRGPFRVYTGVDLGVGRSSKNDQTSIFTIAVDAATQRKYPIHVEFGRWTGPEIIARIKRVYADFGGSIHVEANGAQDFLVQWTQEQGVPVHAFQTTSAKADPAFGVPSIAQDLAAGLWALPEEDAIHKWRGQCLEYTPGPHVGDILMSSWFAREAARTSSYVAGETVDPGGRATATLRARYDIQDRRGLRRVS